MEHRKMQVLQLTYFLSLILKKNNNKEIEGTVCGYIYKCADLKSC